MAVIRGVESAVRIHIERGDDLNARDANGMTPLMLCAARNKPEICTLLLNSGADQSLLDPSGRSALQIAIDAGSLATTKVLGADREPISAITCSDSELTSEQSSIKSACAVASPAAVSSMLAQSVNNKDSFESFMPEEQANQAPNQHPTDFVDLIDVGEIDLSGWEAESEPTRPSDDILIVELASAVQVTISDHQPIDSSADWEDVDAYLPDATLPLARVDNIEDRARLRLLLLRAIREGSVPALDVQRQSRNEDRTDNPEAEAYLTMVINDLGAETDERFEYSSTDENFEVFVDPEETVDEEETLDYALFAIDRATSYRNEPLRIYQREFQSFRLLSAEEEVQLAKDMETALDAALDALATWPDGIARTLTAGADVVTGLRKISISRMGDKLDPGSTSSERFDAEMIAKTEPEDDAELDEAFDDERFVGTGNTTFGDLLRKLTLLVDSSDGAMASSLQIRQALADLKLSRRFLLELISAASEPTGCPEFQIAMAEFRKARDRMVAANLRLSFFLAKKYLYSGEPLDDLTQEANIGLLKAIDRYDWRRGFRFSTYATWWIRQRVARHVANNARTIRLPVYIHERLQRITKGTLTLETVLGREPTLEELAKHVDLPSAELAKLLRIAPEPIDIDEKTIDSMIASDACDYYVAADPADLVEQTQLIRAVDNMISSLSTKDRLEEHVLRIRFGVGVHEELTLAEIGMRFGVTGERIRQIESRAIRKLRNPSRSGPFTHTVLRVQRKKDSLSASTQRPKDDELSDGVEASTAPDAPKQQPAARKLMESTQTAGASKPTALDKMLAQAVELGVLVEDKRATVSGEIWVRLLSAPDSKHRRLIRKLIELGFAHSPGKGYWR